MKSGFFQSNGYKIWYGAAEPETETDMIPLLTLHGGPGGAHYCLQPLEALAAGGRRVIFYDQLGCGQSDHPADPGLWTVNRFLAEIDDVRDQLGLSRIHLLGLSWGGMLGMEYAIRRPAGLASLVIASAGPSIPQWVAECNRLRSELPGHVQAVLAEHEQAGTTGSAAYHTAMREFYTRHVCRRLPWPDYVQKSVDEMDSSPVYLYMNGPSEFYVTGTLRDWDISDKVHRIDVPVLITSGRYDECTPAIVRDLTERIPGAQSVIFENSAHFAHAEEPERYVQVVQDFLEHVDTEPDRV